MGALAQRKTLPGANHNPDLGCPNKTGVFPTCFSNPCTEGEEERFSVWYNKIIVIALRSIMRYNKVVDTLGVPEHAVVTTHQEYGKTKSSLFHAHRMP